MKKTKFLAGLLVLQTIGLIAYSAIAFTNDGYNLFSIFFFNILSLHWNGQFNADFTCYFLLSSLWIIWRNQYSSRSFLIGIAATILGIIVFAPYLLWLIHSENGDLKRVLVGQR